MHGRGLHVQRHHLYSFFTRVDRILRRSLGVSETAPTDTTVKPAPPVETGPINVVEDAAEEGAEPSISVSARSTLGRVKELLPIGPTMPADAVSFGLRNAPRGSRLGFFAFSS